MLPLFRIKIVVEGNEEKILFDIVKMIGTSDIFEISIDNACGSGAVADLFLLALRDDYYDCVVAVYDVDNRQNESGSPYNKTRKQLFDVLGDWELVDLVSFCTNPNILQLFLLAMDTLKNVALIKTSKTYNTEIVHKYWPKIASGAKDSKGRNIKPGYDALEWQLNIIKDSIIYDESKYQSILDNSNELPIDYKNKLPGSNVTLLLKALRSGDIDFFKDITKRISDDSI